MTTAWLVWRNLRYHWRGAVAQAAATAVAAAVLCGALFVGDSLRESLRTHVLRQIGPVGAAAQFPRLIDAAIADRLADRFGARVVPALLLRGAAEAVRTDKPAAEYIGHVNIWGIDDRLARLGLSAVSAVSGRDRNRHAILSRRTAELLGVGVGDRIRLGLERFSDIPRNTLLARRSIDDSHVTLTLTVAAILPADDPADTLTLSPRAEPPLNVFVPLRTLSEAVQPDAGQNAATTPRVNVLLSISEDVDSLNQSLRQVLDLTDYGLRLRPAIAYDGWWWGVPLGYVSVETDRLIFDERAATEVLAAMGQLQVPAEPTIVYLVNGIEYAGREIPYAIVAGVNPHAAPPLGPFVTVQGHFIQDDEIALLDWPESPLAGLDPAGRPKLTLSFYHPEVEGEGRIETHRLRLCGYVPFRPPAADRYLTPVVKGISDQGSRPRDWDRPPQLTNAKVREKIREGDVNDRFWVRYGPTPKAYVTLRTARRLFGSRYGVITSIRVATTDLSAIKGALLAHLRPDTHGLAFRPVRQELLAASRGSTDFGGLFLGFSIFLIAAGLMLIALLFRLALERRAKEIGILYAVGYEAGHIRRLVWSEGLIAATGGAVVGLIVGIGYTRGLIGLLGELWPDAAFAAMIQPSLTVGSGAAGMVAAIVMAVLVQGWTLRDMGKLSVVELLQGVMGRAAGQSLRRRSWRSLALPGVAATAGGILMLLGSQAQHPDERAMSFLAAGAAFLTALLAGLRSYWLRRAQPQNRAVRFRGILDLAWRNTARHPGRSLLTTALLAAAVFVLVAVESFRRQPDHDVFNPHSGSGGFNLIAEMDVALTQSFDSGPGRAELETLLQAALGASSNDPAFVHALEVLRQAESYPLRLREGDEASCANLYAVQRPRVLGVPDRLIERGGFRFARVAGTTPEEADNPWLCLRRVMPEGEIPVFCEQNTAQWVFQTDVGGVILVEGDDGRTWKLRIVGTLLDSPFTGEVLMADAAFARLFPHTDGYRFFLIRTPPELQEAVARLVRLAYRTHGVIVTPTLDRIARAQAIVSAYLTMFQLLGALGLLLGMVGLAIVILRSIWERIRELAIVRAVGATRSQLLLMVLAENAALLLLGTACGVVAAGLAVSSHLIQGVPFPWLQVASLIGGIVLAGLLAVVVAAAEIVRLPLIHALRAE